MLLLVNTTPRFSHGRFLAHLGFPSQPRGSLPNLNQAKPPAPVVDKMPFPAITYLMSSSVLQ